MENGIDKELKKYISDIKRDLLFQIITDVRESNMVLGEVKYLTKDFLQLLPATSKEDILDKLYSLRQIYPQVRVVFTKYIGPLEEEKSQKKLAMIREYMNKGDYSQAFEYRKGDV